MRSSLTPRTTVAGPRATSPACYESAPSRPAERPPGRRTLCCVTVRRPLVSSLPGLALVAACAAAAFGLSRLPGAAVLGPLVLALLVGSLVRALLLRGRELGRFAHGARVAAGPVLKLGIVALGARLDMRAVIELGPAILLGSVLGAVVAFAAAEVAGRALRVPPDLRRAAGMGTAICGASAIAAAAPVLRSTPAHTSAAIGAISLLGTLGVLGFVAYDALAAAGAAGLGAAGLGATGIGAAGLGATGIGAAGLGALAGATLQEVGQVVAAGSVAGAAGADLALLVKLSRVVLLGPALIALAWRPARSSNARRAGARPVASEPAQQPAPAARSPLRWPLPPFVVGFLALGAAVSAGVLDERSVGQLTALGTLLTAAAMAGIGLELDARALRGPGRQALVVGSAAFLALLLAMLGYYALVT